MNEKFIIKYVEKLENSINYGFFHHLKCNVNIKIIIQFVISCKKIDSICKDKRFINFITDDSKYSFIFFSTLVYSKKLIKFDILDILRDSYINSDIVNKNLKMKIVLLCLNGFGNSKDLEIKSKNNKVNEYNNLVYSVLFLKNSVIPTDISEIVFSYI